MKTTRVWTYLFRTARGRAAHTRWPSAPLKMLSGALRDPVGRAESSLRFSRNSYPYARGTRVRSRKLAKARFAPIAPANHFRRQGADVVVCLDQESRRQVRPGLIAPGDPFVARLAADIDLKSGVYTVLQFQWWARSRSSRTRRRSLPAASVCSGDQAPGLSFRAVVRGRSRPAIDRWNRPRT